jgi:hypothetical protein
MNEFPERPDEPEENYFVSLSDLMTGVVFIFVILLCAFAFHYQTEAKAAKTARVSNPMPMAIMPTAQSSKSRAGALALLLNISALLKRLKSRLPKVQSQAKAGSFPVSRLLR